MNPIDFLLVILLLLFNAFFVAAEFALVKVRRGQIEELADAGSWNAAVARKILNNLDAYISACQVGITLASLGLGRLIEGSVEPLVASALGSLGLPHGPHASGFAAGAVVPVSALAIVTFLHIALGELVPKSLAIRAAKPIALATAFPLLMFYYLCFPAIWLLNHFSNLVIRLLRLEIPGHADVAHSEEELRRIVAESAVGGHLEPRERAMIDNVLKLEEKTARRVMVPRPDVAYLALAFSMEENLRVARRAGHTRFPLCGETLDEVLGIVHVKDLFRRAENLRTRDDLRALARPALHLAENIRLHGLLDEFKRHKVHMAILVDEFGSTVGIVTLENVLEELVGPIDDEFDTESPLLRLNPDGSCDADPACPLDTLAETLGLPPLADSDDDLETLGELVLDRLGRLARQGDSVRIHDRLITVTRTDPTRIRKLRIHPPTAPSGEEGAESGD